MENEVIVCAIKPLIVVGLVSMRCSRLSHVDTVNKSICSVVGGANRPLIPKEISVPTAIAVVNGDDIVTVWVENDPEHEIEELLIDEVRP